MDGERFDHFARALAADGTRRAFIARLSAAGAGVVAALRITAAGTAACRATGRSCRESANCCGDAARVYDPRVRRSVCTRGEAAELCGNLCLDCSVLDAACAVGVCDAANSVCVAQPINEGGACELDDDLCTPDVCQNGVCQPGQPIVCDPCWTCVDGDCVVEEQNGSPCESEGEFGAICCGGVCADLPDDRDRVCCGIETCLPEPVCSCDGRECGDDGCGGSCEPGCSGTDVCSDAGLCVPCVRDCTGGSCDDGCGGPCFECGDGLICQDGQCVSNDGRD